MPNITDQDSVFVGKQSASLPKELLEEGVVSRLINGRFSEGCITNALSWDEFEPTFQKGNNSRPLGSPVSYGELLTKGDFQLAAPLDNINGKFLVLVISETLFVIDTETWIAYDQTPTDAFFPTSSLHSQLSYLDNNAGRYGAGGYAVIFNWPNRPIFVGTDGARKSKRSLFEMPPSRMGATAGERAFVISGANILWASDPLGGASDFAPLTFSEIYTPSTGYTDQIFEVGSGLDVSTITCVARLPKFLGPNQDFLAQNLLISTNKNKFIIAASAPRSTWTSIQFITYAGALDGIAGPRCATNVGDNLIYVSSTGRVKQISQDQEVSTGMSETFMDDDLGQFTEPCENKFYYREWYEHIDHSRSVLKFNRNRLFGTAYPVLVPAISRNGRNVDTISHKALSTASLSSDTQIGPRANLQWEGFYDFLQPVGIVDIDTDTFVISKDFNGHIKYFRLNRTVPDNHKTTIYTRGYFKNVRSDQKGFIDGQLVFGRLAGNPEITVSYLVNDEWVIASQGRAKCPLYQFKNRTGQSKTNNSTIPLKIEIDHNGCVFELKSIKVGGETYAYN